MRGVKIKLVKTMMLSQVLEKIPTMTPAPANAQATVIRYKNVNILEDPEIRIKLSEYSNWPTIPQLFVNGELVGGCDIVTELEGKGELGSVLANAGT